MKPLWHVGVLLLLSGFIPLAAEEKKSSKLEISSQEQTIIDLVNKERKKEKLPLLKPNPLLFKAARAHSENMAKQQKMEHKLDGKTPAQRVRAVGYRYRACGENIAAGGPRWALSEVHQAWMDSEGHRDNILGKNYTQIGIGIAKSEQGELYYTQVFARPARR